MRNWIRHIDGLIGNLIIFNWRHHLQKVAEQWTDAELAEKMKSIPSKERQEAWLRVARKPYTEEERDAARAKLVQLLDRMEEALSTLRLAGRPAPIRSPISPLSPSSSGSTRRSRRIRYPKSTIPASPNGGLGSRRGRPSHAPISAPSSTT